MGEKSEKGTFSLAGNLRFVLHYAWKWKPGFIIAQIVTVPVSLSLSVAAIYFPKILIDRLERQSQTGMVITWIAAYTLFVILINLISSWLEKVIRSSRYYFQFRFQYLKTDKLMHTDYRNVESLYGMNLEEKAGYGHECEEILYDLANLYKSIFGLLLYGGGAAFVSPVVFFVILATTYINFFMMKKGRIIENRNLEKSLPATRKLGYLQGISFDYRAAKDIKVCGMSDWIQKMSKKFQKEQFAYKKKTSRWWLITYITEAFCYLLREGVVYLCLICEVLQDKISAGDFVFLFGMAMGVSRWISSIIAQVSGIGRRNMEIGYLREYLMMEDFYNHGTGVETESRKDRALPVRLENVFYQYNQSEKNAITNLNLNIRAGEKIAVVGLNGAGKTTLAKLICGLYFPTGGHVYVDEIDSVSYNIDSYYELFSPVFQDIFTIGISIERFVGSSDGGNAVDRERVYRSLHRVGLEKVIEKLPKGLETILGKGVYEGSMELSGGELQKLMLARALYKDAPIMILDEPTSALDPLAEQELYRNFCELTKDKTTVFISHRLASTRFCDRIIFMKNGEIAEEGTHDDLMKNNQGYAEMFRVQSRYYKEEA